MGSSTIADKVRFGLLATGSIAAEVADALVASGPCTAHVVGSRDLPRAEAFAAAHGIPNAATYEEVLTDPEVDVVYVATPHTEHERLALAAIEAGKNVLCEKPITITAAGAERVIRAAAERGVFVLEAFAYWFHPQTELLLELVGNGSIGRVRAIDVTFSYGGRDDSSYHLNHSLAGGSIFDVGCYCTSMAARIAAVAIGTGTAEPEEVVGMAVFEPTERTDEHAAALMRFPGDILADLVCGAALARPDLIRVLGEDGYLETTQPAWLEGHRSDETGVDLVRPGKEPERRVAPGGVSIFTREVDGMAALLAGGQEERDAHVAATLANMRTLDRWRDAVGLRYEFEK
jgi:predicted dehydrogenase